MHAAVRFFSRPRNGIALIGCLASVAMVVAARAPVTDPDVWWVAAAGREMLETGRVITENRFSFTEPEHPWTMHEWLLALPYAAGLTRLGPPFFNLVALVSLGTALALLGKWTFRSIRHPGAILLLLMIAIGCFGGRFLTARPSGVALLFPLALVWVAFNRRFRWPHAAMALLLEALWANAHGSFPLGPVLMGLAAAERHEDRGARAATAVAMILVTLFNPYGLGLHELVLEYLFGNRGIYREIHGNIAEFKSFWAAWGKTTGPGELIGLVAVSALALGALTQSSYRLRGLFSIALIASAVLHARHVEQAGLVSCMLLAPYLGSVAGTDSATDVFPASALPFVLGSAYLCGAVAFGLATAQRRPLESLGPAKEVAMVLRDAKGPARAYVPFPVSGMAIWYGFPRNIRVFYDARNDCYSAATHRQFFSLGRPTTPAATARQILNSTGTDAVLVPTEHPLAILLNGESNWTREASRGRWRLFRKPLIAPDDSRMGRIGHPGKRRGSSAALQP